MISRPGSRVISLRASIAVTAAIVAIQALVLHLEGRVTYCTCGYVKFWEGDVLSAGNSQHVTDWYSFSHVIHGYLLYLLFWLVGRRWPIGLRLVAAIALESSWEMVENSSFVIDRYRAETISLNYYGDSIVNSVSDTLTAVCGFVVARVVPVWATVASALVMELFVGWAIHDNLTLNIIMLIYPMEWIKAWQTGAHP